MKKMILVLLILFLFPAWTTIPIQTTNTQNMDVYAMTGKLNWKASFNEPFEVLYLLMYDSSLIGLTTMEEHRISVGVEFIREFLEADGYEIADIAIIIHNHFHAPFMSWGNGLVLKKLRNEGFKGSFGVYHSPTDTIKWAERSK